MVLRDGAVVVDPRSWGEVIRYRVDLGNPAFAAPLAFARALSGEERWTKIQRITRYVGETLFPAASSDAVSYETILDRHKDGATPIPLSEFVSARSGRSREHALVLHLLLKESGEANRLVFGTRSHFSGKGPTRHFHGFVVVDHPPFGQVTADSYYSGFHGYQLGDLMAENGIEGREARGPDRVRWTAWRAPFADGSDEPRARKFSREHNSPQVLYSSPRIGERKGFLERIRKVCRAFKGGEDC